MKPGRNDFCPCGSGKKYKKCCLGKAPHDAEPTAAAQPVEPRLYSPVRCYYTEAALAEAMNSGGLVRIHPYVLIKLRDDPRLLDTAHPKDRARILQTWSASKLAAMPTEEIEMRLQLIGVLSYDRAEFIQRTKARQSAWETGEEWGRPLAALSQSDRDFLGLAACELWRRLCFDRPSLEMIDDWLCEGYAFSMEKKPAQAIAAWWKVWETLRSHLTPEIKTLHDAGERLFPRMSQCLSNWSVDFVHESLNASLSDKACGELGIRFIQELLEALPEEDNRLNLSGNLAELLFQVQREAEAEQRCQRLIQNHSDRAVGYVILSDGLLRGSWTGCPDPGRCARAIELLEQALAYPVTDAEDYDLTSRLAAARELLSKAKSF